MQDKIYEKGLWEEFRNKFLGMFKDIFSHDLIIAIKNNLNMTIYFIDSTSFYKIMENSSNTPEDIVKIINRWEGNSIRLDRNKFLLDDFKIELSFNYLDSSIMKIINTLEKEINTTIIKYYNNYHDKAKIKDNLITEIQELFFRIDTINTK